MSKKKFTGWRLFIFLALLLTGCTTFNKNSVRTSPLDRTAPGQASGDILARVGDRVITVPGFQERFNTLPSNRRQGATGEEQKEKFLERMVETFLFSLEARDKGIDKETPLNYIIQDTVDNILAREYYQREMLSGPTITEDEIKNYYDSHPDEFINPEAVKARHILVMVKTDAPQNEWNAALERAKDLKNEIDNGADFNKIAGERSDDGRTKKRGGDLGYLTREKIPDGFPDILFTLKTGEISDPVKGSEGYHIIKVETKRPKRIQTISQVKRKLERKLKKQKQDDLLAKEIKHLKEKYGVVLNTDLLSSVVVQKNPAKGKKSKG